MSLLDFFTGGKNRDAIDALNRAEGYFNQVQSPTVQQLTLPQLQQYVEAGMMTPAQAQAYLEQSNAYKDENIDQTGTDAQIKALNQLSRTADAGPNGTPLQQAQMENTIQKMNTSVGGQRGAIEQAMAARGVPMSLIQAALENQTVGQEAQQAHLDAVNAQGQTYQNALTALSQSGQLGSSLQGQQNTQANTVAGAQNAMQQFNAQNQQQNAQFNAGNQQNANAANFQNKQQVSNNNIGNANDRTKYNANLPQEVYNNQVQKAAGQAGAATNIGNMQQQQGQQNAGLWSGIIGSTAGFLKPTAQAANPGTDAEVAAMAHGGIVRPMPPINRPPTSPSPTDVGSVRGYHDHSVCMAHGGICMAGGGEVPGEADFPGDTTMNDKVPANLSPGEAVITRTKVQEHPDEVADLLGPDDDDDGSQVDYQDVATLLKALRSIRMGVVNE